jgi:hypothetical protein
LLPKNAIRHAADEQHYGQGFQGFSGGGGHKTVLIFNLD